MSLSLRAQKWLRERAQKARKMETLSRQKLKFGTVLQEVVEFSQNHGIQVGRPLNGGYYEFNPAAITEIQAFCDFTQDFASLNRAQAAQLTGNEKVAGESPMDYRVMVAVPHSPMLKPYQSPQLNIEVDIRLLDLSAYSHLVVVENRDSFNDWWKFQVTDILENPLVVYRGHTEEGRWLKHLRQQWAEQHDCVNTVYFGDFDLPGMRFAMDYHAYLLPAESCLQHRLNSAHFSAEHESYAQGLQADCPDGWRSLLSLMLSQRKALRQQLMYDVELVLYSREVDRR